MKLLAGTARDLLQRHRSGCALGVLALALLLTPVAVSNPYYLGLGNLIGLYVLVVLGLNVFIGFAGQISLGHAAFFGLGAYGSAILTTSVQVPAWAALVATALAVALLAVLIGLPTLRLHGHYLAMATLGMNYVFHITVVEWDRLTGGPSGLSGVPSLSFFGLALDDEVRFHYLIWSAVFLALILCLNLLRSGVGRGLAALAQDETAAACLGVNVRAGKLKTFVLSAVFASVAGSLFAHYFGYVNPEAFGVFKSVDLVIMVVVGGIGSVWGSLFGAAFVTLLPHWLEFLADYFDLIHGALLVLILLFLPQGLVTGLRERLHLYLVQRLSGPRPASREQAGQ